MVQHERPHDPVTHERRNEQRDPGPNPHDRARPHQDERGIEAQGKTTRGLARAMVHEGMKRSARQVEGHPLGMCFAEPRHHPAEHRRKSERLGFVASFDSFGVQAVSVSAEAMPLGKRSCSMLIIWRFIGIAMKTPRAESAPDPEKIDARSSLVHGEIRAPGSRDGAAARHVTGGRRDRCIALFSRIPNSWSRELGRTEDRADPERQDAAVMVTPSPQPVLNPTYRFERAITPPSNIPVTIARKVSWGTRSPRYTSASHLRRGARLFRLTDGGRSRFVGGHGVAFSRGMPPRTVP